MATKSKLITLKQAELFEVSTKLAKAYRNTFTADTLSNVLVLSGPQMYSTKSG